MMLEDSHTGVEERAPWWEEDFLDMTMSQAHIWASQNIDPSKTPSELILTEPYLMGSHASATGAWCSSRTACARTIPA